MAKDAEKPEDARKKDGDEKPWEASKRGKKKDAKVAKDEGDEEGDEDEDEDEDDDEANKSAAAFRADLRTAVDLLSRHTEQRDPALRREALLAKELRGGGLTKSERQELIAALDDSPPTNGLGDRALQQVSPGEALGKSLAANKAVAETHEAHTKMLALFADALEKSQKEQAETQYLMARTLTRLVDAVEKSLDESGGRQEELARSVAAIGQQPAHAPRSVGLSYREKSFAGAGDADPLEKASRGKLIETLQGMAKSEPRHSEMRDAYEMAALGLRVNTPLVPLVAERLREHLREAG